MHKKVVGGFVKERMVASPPTPYKKGGSAPSLTSPARGPVPLTPFILTHQKFMHPCSLGGGSEGGQSPPFFLCIANDTNALYEVVKGSVTLYVSGVGCDPLRK
ncbi:hypothetical protein MBAV_004903 [Candidatus Magnetobacterium bavaricum]|uniref:Uncharacterized protein n=1 Tax=Candidatus Magnetobacterium bavaricum TaxID=29290 RepID=A0A0F3GLW8_9BACT|nr:hypothetical protein MBAV_004903 [Candidatus Magnetobacterium bavaricum]